MLQKSQLSPERNFAGELSAALMVQHSSGLFFFHLLSALDNESSLKSVQICLLGHNCRSLVFCANMVLHCLAVPVEEPECSVRLQPVCTL